MFIRKTIYSVIQKTSYYLHLYWRFYTLSFKRRLAFWNYRRQNILHNRKDTLLFGIIEDKIYFIIVKTPCFFLFDNIIYFISVKSACFFWNYIRQNLLHSRKDSLLFFIFIKKNIYSVIQKVTYVLAFNIR